MKTSTLFRVAAIAQLLLAIAAGALVLITGKYVFVLPAVAAVGCACVLLDILRRKP